MNELLKKDKVRNKKLPRFQALLRKASGGGYFIEYYIRFLRECRI